MVSVDTNRIEKQVLIQAPRARVWRALTTASEFGTWFGVKISGTFAAGARLRGPVTHKGYEHYMFDIVIERFEPERLLAWRWHHSEDPSDGTTGPTTQVLFELEEADGGTMLRVVESGFDALPASRREQVFRQNEGGWTQQVENIARHVGTSA